MAKVNTGHAVNVENFNQIKINLANMGETWNPVHDSISLAKLTAHHTDCLTVLKKLNEAIAVDKKLTGERQTAYVALAPTVNRVIAAMKSAKMDASIIESATVLKDLIDGSNIRKITTKRKNEAKKRAAILPTEGEVAADATKTRSVSQLAYDAQLANFDKLIAVLETAGNYRTNHSGITLAELKVFAEHLRQANNNTNDAFDLLANQRKERNELLYKSEDCLMNRVEMIKAELQALEGKKGVNYKKASDFTFYKPK